jgi:hypothetical protein
MEHSSLLLSRYVVGTYSREVRFPLFCCLDADTVIHGVKS